MPSTVVLETFQTYHAFFRAVKPERLAAEGSTGLNLHENREQTRNMPLQLAFSPESAQQGTGAFNFAKDLVLEVLRFPLTCQETLSLTSSPVAGAASMKLNVLDAGFSCGIQNLSRIRRRQ